MYKKVLKITIAHLLIILYWGFLFKGGKIVEEGPVLNGASIFLLFSLYFLIYTGLSNREIPGKASNFFICLSLLPPALILAKGLSYKPALAALSLASTGFYLKKYLNSENARDINILPISRSAAQVFSFCFLALSLFIIYIFDFNAHVVHIIYQLLFFTFELVLLLFLKEQEDNYEKIYKLYYLSDYMAQERNEFARIIHDEIIQDIFAARNYLSLKNPDIDYGKQILKDLEGKARRIMKLYQSQLFEGGSLEISLASVFENIGALYPDKKIKVEKEIEDDLLDQKDKDFTGLVSLISKELVNNAYKHSKAGYLKYRLYRRGPSVVIDLESDGTGREDFQRIQESKRGILLLRLLLDSNAGTIDYALDGDRLKTRVVLEVEDRETSFIR